MRRFTCLAVAALAACSSSSMVPDPPNYGAACPPASCVGGTTCATGAAAGGFCTSVCTPGTSGTCMTGGTCSSWFGTPLCLHTCSATSDCASGFQCWRGACVGPCAADSDCGTSATCGADMHCTGPECVTSADCGAGRTCSASRCVDGPPPPFDAGPPTLNQGDPCVASAQCVAGLVCLPASLGGTCQPTCTSRTSCGSVDLVCVPVPVDRDGDGTADFTATTCIPDDLTMHRNAQTCNTSADCAGHLCLQWQCSEVCAMDGDCLPGQHCVSGTTLPGGPPDPFSACGYTPPPAVSDVIDIPLGSFPVSTTAISPNIAFAIDPSAVSLTLIAQQETGVGQTIAFIDLYDPAATHLYAISDIESWTDPLLRWIPQGTEGIGTMMTPNSTSDRYVFVQGRYLVNFGIIGSGSEPASATVDLTARVKRAPSPPTSGVLDLDIWTVATGLTAASAPGDTFLQTAITEMTSLYSELGISIGTIRYIDVSSGDWTAYHLISSVDGPTSELSSMFQLGTGRTGNTLDLFIVDRIEVSSGEGLVTLGISGGIPGPPGVHGSPHSGVAVAYDRSVIGSGTGGAQRLGQVMAHECGHYLGFFHTTEGARACGPGEVPSATDMCAPFGGGDVLSDTIYGVDTYVMYWAAMGGRIFTTGQSWVALRNPLVH